MVVTDSKNAAKSGKFLEVVGSYNARGGKAQLDKERISHWLAKGVKLTDTVQNILINHKVIETKKTVIVRKKSAKSAKKAASKS